VVGAVIFKSNGISRAVNQLNISHGSLVTGSEAALENTNITTGTSFVPGAKLIKKLTYRLLAAQAAKGQATIGNGIRLRQSDHGFSKCPQLFRFGQRGFDNFMLDQGGNHVAKHGATVSACLVELSSTITMTHGKFL